MTINTQTNPQGRYPPGTVRPVTGQENTVCDESNPPDAAVIVYYHRHYDTEQKAVVGHTTEVLALKFDARVFVKTSWSGKLEVWIDVKGKPKEKLFTYAAEELVKARREEREQNPDFQAYNETQAAKFQRGEPIGSKPPLSSHKPKKAPPTGPHCIQCLKEDEGDLVDHDNKQYCMTCYIGVARG